MTMILTMMRRRRGSMSRYALSADLAAARFAEQKRGNAGVEF
jgi:Flp pilus assembly protein TadG